MSLRKSIDSVLDVLGLIGFTVRSDRKKGAWKKLDDRVWGTPVAGFSLSAQLRPAQALRTESVKAAVAIRNATGADVHERIPDWVHYFAITVIDPSGVPLQLSAFGQRVMGSGSGTKIAAVFPAAVPVQNELPLSDLFDLSRSGVYRIAVSCAVPGSDGREHCESNPVELIRS